MAQTDRVCELAALVDAVLASAKYRHIDPHLAESVGAAELEKGRSLKDAIKAVTGLIEPVMILLMGTVVGFIAMAIILPIFKMSQIVK